MNGGEVPSTLLLATQVTNEIMFESNLKYIKILLLEDSTKMANLMKDMLHQMGIENVEWAKSFDEAAQLFDRQLFDVMLLDIDLGKGMRRGDDFARYVRRKQAATPIIYVTSLYQDKIYNDVMDTKPHSFMSKDIGMLGLKQALELAIIKEQRPTENKRPILHNSDNYFIKIGDVYKSIPLEDVSYFFSKDRTIFLRLEGRNYPINARLKELEEQFSLHGFVRTHRAYLVNIKRVTSINLQDDKLSVDGTESVPIGYAYRKQIFSHINLLL